MYPNELQNNQKMTQSTVDWLNSYAPQPAPPKKSRHKIIIFVIVIIFVAICILVSAVYLISQSRKMCLSESNYLSLSGRPMNDSIDPVENFYSLSVAFETNSTNILKSNSSDVSLEKLVDFYKAHSSTDIELSIDATYSDQAATELALHRQSMIKSKFINSNIDPSDITVNSPELVTPDDADTDGIVIISMRSTSKCKK